MKEWFVPGLERQIGSAASFVQLRELRRQIHEYILASLPSMNALQEIVRLNRTLNHIHDCLMRRTIALSEGRLLDQGCGPSPVPYAVVLFGSGGRKELTLWSDQDNGMIYRPLEPSIEKKTELYFLEFGKAVSDGLRAVGYPPCEGNVVCGNPQWTKPLTRWKETLDQWFSDPVFEHVRYLLIAADMRFVYGDADLFRQLKSYYMNKINENPSILNRMLKNTLRHKVTLNLFGQLIKERYGKHAGGVEIKYGAYIPMVNGIRHLALACGVQASSTLERIEELMSTGLIPAENLEIWKKAFIRILQMRLLADHQEEGGIFSSNGVIPADRLTKQTIAELKFCLRSGKRLQRFVANTVEDIVSGGGS